MKQKFLGKRILITGGDSGLGRLFATRFISHGASVAISTRADSLVTARSHFSDHIESGKAFIFEADLNNIDEVRKLPDRMLGALGGIDVLINNAGIRMRKAFLSVEPSDWSEVLDVNVRAPYFLCQTMAKMLQSGNQPAAIVNIASQLGLVAARDYSLYCVSKAALIAMTRSLALELARSDISVNAVAPGPTNTMAAGLLKDDDEAFDLLRKMPLGRRVESTEVAESVEFLAANPGSALTGHTVVIDGGWTNW